MNGQLLLSRLCKYRTIDMHPAQPVRLSKSTTRAQGWPDAKKELITMKIRMTVVASALALMSLTGCATHSQIEEQNKQLTEINLSLKVIQAQQASSLAMQQVQTKMLMDTYNLVNDQSKLPLPARRGHSATQTQSETDR
jgi:murein lipoprotein